MTDTDTPPVGREIDPNEFGFASDDTAPMRCNEPGCTNELHYSGRGRKPTKCDEHKGTRTTGTRTPRGWSGSAEVEQVLIQYVNALGTGVTFINPLDGRVIATGGPAIAHELVELAKSDMKLRKTLTSLTRPGKYGPLTLATMAVVLPIMANHHLLPQFRVPGATPDTDTPASDPDSHNGARVFSFGRG